jgi:hypothetical protein
VHRGKRFEYLPDRARPLRGDPPRKPRPNASGRRWRPLGDLGYIQAYRRHIGRLQVLAHTALSTPRRDKQIFQLTVAFSRQTPQ